MNTFKKKVLDYLNIKEEDLRNYTKDVTFSDLEDPYQFLNMQKAVDRIKQAIDKKEKIMIYGDYDCDGISATSILVKMFMKFHINVGYYIPSRYIDGYGITLFRSQQLKEKNYDLVITVDNGVAALEALTYLKEQNIDVILTDHHAITRELPPSYCVLHPDLKENKTVKQCGAYVAFMLATALLGEVDPYLLSLATLATISDMMPLLNENRTLVRLGLKILNEHPEYPTHALLKENTFIDEEVLGFQVCPKINAFGRMKEDISVNKMVQFFTKPVIFQSLALEIESTNQKRKSLMQNIFDSLDLQEAQNDKVVILYVENVLEGLIGLIASKVLTDYQKPCIVFTDSNDKNVLKGSARSLPGLNLEHAFSFCKDYMLQYGGHELAGGLSIEKNKFEEFKHQFHLFAEDKVIKEQPLHGILIDQEDITLENYQFIKSLSPFGVEYPSPKFLLKVQKSSLKPCGTTLTHIRGNLPNNNSIIGFNISYDELVDEPILFGTLEENIFYNKRNLQFKIEKVLNSLEESYLEV